MYNEGKPRSLLSLLIRIIIIIIFLILVIWLVSKVINKSNNNAFEKNMIIMKNASIEYFKKGNLPQEEGESKKVTLDDLIKMKYITSFDKKCDRQKSYSQATMVDDYYALRVELLCGNKKDYIYTSIDKDGNCLGDNCDDEALDNNKKDNEENKDNDENKNKEVEEYDKNQEIETENDSSAKNDNSSDNSDSSNNNEGKTLYYEHVRVNKVYSNWQYNRISGNNVETKQEQRVLNNYCPLLTSDYYVATYYYKNIDYVNMYRNVIRLDNIPSNTTYIKIKNSELFNDNITYYNNYINNSQKTTMIIGDNAYGMVSNAQILQKVSLKNNNAFIKKAFITSGSYGLGVEFWIKINNVYNVYNYNNRYYVPIHFVVEYADKASCVKDTSSNASNYSGYIIDGTSKDTVTLYRSYSYQKDENDKKWSTSKSIDGYVLTGNSEYR